MDLSFLTNLFQGNNGILILLALFLFKDQLLSLFGPKPAPAPVVPLPTPPVVVPVAPDERPVVDAIVKLLPVILPVVVELLKKEPEPPK